VIQTSAGPDQQADSSDPRLIERFREGEPAALDEVIERYQLDVTRTVRRLLGWRGDVEDVVQEVFLAALRRHRTFRGQSSLKTWLIAIAIRRCRSQRRRFWKSWLLPQREESPADESIQRDEVAEQVRIAVRKLGTKEREVVVLYYLEELSVAEVAKILGISEGAIDVRLHRARKKLKEMLSCMN